MCCEALCELDVQGPAQARFYEGVKACIAPSVEILIIKAKRMMVALEGLATNASSFCGHLWQQRTVSEGFKTLNMWTVFLTPCEKT